MSSLKFDSLLLRNQHGNVHVDLNFKSVAPFQLARVCEATFDSSPRKLLPIRARFTSSEIILRALATTVICRRANLPCSKALLRAAKPSILAVAKMPAFAELHNENTVSEPAFKSQKTEAISTLQVKLLSAAATLPKRGSAKAAGYDLARQAIRSHTLLIAVIDLLSVS